MGQLNVAHLAFHLFFRIVRNEAHESRQLAGIQSQMLLYVDVV